MVFRKPNQPSHYYGRLLTKIYPCNIDLGKQPPAFFPSFCS